MTNFLLAGGLNQPSVPEVVWWLSAGLLVYVYIGYPFLLAVLAPFFRRENRQPGYCPTVTMIIAAYNEEAAIGRKLRETLALKYPDGKLEIIVASDASTDATDDIVKSFHDPRIRLLRLAERRGKTHAQNEAVKTARGEVVVFSDATAIYHPESLLYLALNYEDPRVGAVSGRYQYFDPSGVSPSGLGSVAFWNYENSIKKLQSRIRTLTGCSGCIYSVRRSVYVPLPDEACSDLVEPLCIVRAGYRVAFEPGALAYEETTKSSAEEFGMRVRVAGRGIRGVLSVAELLKLSRHGWISFQLLSHKVLRWMAPVFLILIFLSSIALAGIPVYRYLLLLQVAFYLAAAVMAVAPVGRRWRVLALPLYFCTLNGAVLVSLIRMLRGQRFVVWQTVRK